MLNSDMQVHEPFERGDIWTILGELVIHQLNVVEVCVLIIAIRKWTTFNTVTLPDVCHADAG